MKRLSLILFLLLNVILAAQNKNSLLTGTYYYFELNENDGVTSSAISKVVFDGNGSALYTVVSPSINDAGNCSYTIDEKGELTLQYADSLIYHGAVKKDGEVFLMCMTDSCYFSEHGMGVGIKVGPGSTGFSLNDFYNLCGYIPSSSRTVFNFSGRKDNDSVFYCSDIPGNSVGYKMTENGLMNFTANQYLVESVFSASGMIGVGCHTGGNADGIFSAINNKTVINDIFIDKKFTFFQFFDGYYKDASVLKMNCRPDGTGDYVKKYFSNKTGDLTGTFTYSIKNNILSVIESGDTMKGSITDDFGLFFLLRENEYFSGFCAGLAEITSEPSGVQEHTTKPQNFALEQNYPNPFNPTTKIQYAVGSGSAGNSTVQLRVYDILGNEVATLVNEHKAPGYYEVEFNGSNLATGVYFYKLTAGSFTATKKLVLMK